MKQTKKALLNFLSSQILQNAILFLLLALLIAYYIHVVKTERGGIFDDAYMFIRYADNYLNGYGIAWNRDGIQTYGVTSILYFAAVTFARSLFPGIEAGILLTTLSAAFGLPAIAILAYTCSKVGASYLPKNSFLLLTTIFTGYFITSNIFRYHIITGMDTTLSFLCNSVFILCLLEWVGRKENDTKLLISAVFTAYLTYLARPDNIFYIFTFPFLGIVFLAISEKKKRFLHFFESLFFILIIDALIKHIIFNDPIPLAFYAKSNGYYEGYAGIGRWNPLDYLFRFGIFVLPFLIIIIFSFTKHTWKTFIVFATPVILTFSYYFSVVQIMGFKARYYFPATPYLIVAAFFMLACHFNSELNQGYQETAKRKTARLAVIFFIVYFFSRDYIQDAIDEKYRRFITSSARLYAPTTKYTVTATTPLPGINFSSITIFFAALPNGTTVAASEYGEVGAKAPNIFIVDMVGLHDPYFARNGFSIDEFISRKPDVIWFPHFHYTKINTSIIDSKNFWDNYEYYPEALSFGVAIRKDSPKYAEIYELFYKVWQEAYAPLKIKDYLAIQK